ncbi:hypothetical protein SAMN05660477_00415 [Soonwooa buanensis]|uniref:Uncharacterized protein n=1 Tax=Soonwooa buanensis TaxID=619805 RepID=A0A1T5CWG0_9FLAO|nr:hypothetical protein [Soonwooa buanensis]SKB63764.1 hypothetical protein SAMN05660477_00415 [Soonwooa buanensis]
MKINGCPLGIISCFVIEIKIIKPIKNVNINVTMYKKGDVCLILYFIDVSYWELFFAVADNGKRIGEVADKLDEKFNLAVT